MSNCVNATFRKPTVFNSRDTCTKYWCHQAGHYQSQLLWEDGGWGLHFPNSSLAPSSLFLNKDNSIKTHFSAQLTALEGIFTSGTRNCFSNCRRQIDGLLLPTRHMDLFLGSWAVCCVCAELSTLSDSAECTPSTNKSRTSHGRVVNDPIAQGSSVNFGTSWLGPTNTRVLFYKECQETWWFHCSDDVYIIRS